MVLYYRINIIKIKLYYYSKDELSLFQKLFDEFIKIDASSNPLYKETKLLFASILNIFALIFNHMAEKTKDKQMKSSRGRQA